MKPNAILVVILFFFMLPAASFALEGPDAFDEAAYLRQWTETLRKGDARTKILALNDPPGLLKCGRDKADLRAFYPIFNALKNQNPSVREAAVTALKRIAEWSKDGRAGTDITLLLIKALKDSSPQVRKEAAGALAYYKDKGAVASLIESLKDRDPWVRLNAAFALGELGDKGTILPLLELLHDNLDWRNKYVQQEGLIAMRKIANTLPSFPNRQEVVPVLSEKFNDEYLKAEIIIMVKNTSLCSPNIPFEMTTAYQGYKAAEKYQQKFSEERKWSEFCASQFKEKIIMATQDPSEAIRRLALEALANPSFGGTREIEKEDEVIRVKHPALAVSLTLVKDPSAEVRIKAIESLGRLCPPSDSAKPATEAVRGTIVETLIEALHDSNIKVKEEAILALGRISDERAVSPLIGVLHDSNADIQEKAIEALGRIGDASAIRPLIEVLHDSKANSQKKAVEALGKFEDEKILEELIPLLSSKNYNREAVKATFFAIAEKSCQERAYVYRQNGVRYCAKSQKEIP